MWKGRGVQTKGLLMYASNWTFDNFHTDPSGYAVLAVEAWEPLAEATQ